MSVGQASLNELLFLERKEVSLDAYLDENQHVSFLETLPDEYNVDPSELIEKKRII